MALENICENVEIDGVEISGGVYEINSIKVKRSYSAIKDFGALGKRLADSLNKPSNQIGKDWRLLEAGPDKSYVVSGFFDEGKNSYHGYCVVVDSAGLDFCQYDFRKNGMPWKIKGKALVLEFQLKWLVDTLVGGSDV
ncbi:MAG: hypothetical protein ABIB71_09170 [Candidatus Woesearchaeota archaeon]